MSKKRQLAVRWTVEELTTTKPGSMLRLWTLTTEDTVTDPKEVNSRWSAFAHAIAQELDSRYSALKRRWVKVGEGQRRWGGVRVTEPHPDGHGFHIHFVTPSWLPVEMVRSVAQRCGFGRIHVAKPDKRNGIGHYLAKYLGKALDQCEGCGARMWSVFGFGRLRQTRVRDVECTFPGCQVFRAEYRAAKDEGGDHWTALCRARAGAARWVWDWITGPDLAEHPF